MNIKKILKTPWLSSAAVIFTGLYYGTLDIWGDDWKWISEYKNVHAAIYCIFIVVTILSVVIKSYFEYKDNKDEVKREILLKEFLQFIRNVVHAKRTRFYDCVTRIPITKRINFFDEITHPKDQLRYIMDQVAHFMKFYGVPRSNIEMTVIGASDNNEWKYEVELDRQRNYTDANLIMNSTSLAKVALDKGESIFLSDLAEGIRQNIFAKSARSDSVNNAGSIYCKPVTIKIQGKTYKYVFTLVSYGTYFCSPTDQNEANEFATLLDEIGDRVELELYLLAMKQHKNS